MAKENNWSVQSVIDNQLKKEQRRGKPTCIHASDLGKCKRQTIYKMRGTEETNPSDPRGLRIFSCGNTFHEWIGNILEKAGVLISKEQKIKSEEHNYEGTYDAIVEKEGVKLLYDFKSQHSNSFHWMERVGDANEMHKMQVASYAVMGNLKVKECRILYISKDDLCLAEYPVKIEDYKDKVIEELKALNSCLEKEELPPQIEETENNKPNWQCRFCRYKDLCRGKDWEANLKKGIKNKTSTKTQLKEFLES